MNTDKARQRKFQCFTCLKSAQESPACPPNIHLQLTRCTRAGQLDFYNSTEMEVYSERA